MRLGAITSHILFRLLGRPLLFAIPFALFFFIMSGNRPADLPAYYLAALVFSLFINLANVANATWIVPRLSSAERAAEGKPLILEIASFTVSSLGASLLAALTLHLTIVPGMLGSGHDVLRLVTWSCLFAALVMGLIYAIRFQRQLLDRVRTEAERKGREEEELRIAAKIQQALLPPRSLVGPTFTAAGASIPCRTIGGDFFDTFELSDGRLGFVLGDVAGKGPPAAILAAMVQGIFATHVGPETRPAETLDRVNKALLRRAIEGRFVTLVYGLLSPGGALATAVAGHNPTFLIRADGRLERLEKGGLMVGVFDSAPYEDERVALGSGDTVILYSDGVTDATSPSGEQFGEERFLAALTTAHRETPEDLVARLVREISSFADGQPPADDVTLLVVRYRAASRSTS